jgi:hypothetical protein
MKVALFTLAMLLAGCATARPPTLNDARSDAPSTSRSTGNFNRDVSECERQAALSSAGSKAQAFDSCMRARNQTPKLP